MPIVARAPSERDPVAGFDHQKSIETAAFFIESAGGAVDKLKLIKLMYLAERAFIEQHGLPMNMDEFYSLPHGPILSSALNGINHELSHPAWHALTLKGNRVGLSHSPGREHLSEAEMKVLAEIWRRFGSYSAGELRRYTHKNCPEYTELEASRLPIQFEHILEAVGRTGVRDAGLETRSLQAALARLTQARDRPSTHLIEDPFA